jgi:hypothetical protein
MPTPAAGSFDANLINAYKGKNPLTQWWMK